MLLDDPIVSGSPKDLVQQQELRLLGLFELLQMIPEHWKRILTGLRLHLFQKQEMLLRKQRLGSLQQKNIHLLEGY